jgi:hypothetical protein
MLSPGQSQAPDQHFPRINSRKSQLRSYAGELLAAQLLKFYIKSLNELNLSYEISP